MIDLSKEHFCEHLKTICKDKNLYQYCIDYYNDLGKKFKHKIFTKDDFQELNIKKKDFISLNVKTETFQSDILADVFQDRDTITIQEYFVYLFTKFVKSIKFKKGLKDEYSGMVYFGKKSIVIRQQSDKDIRLLAELDVNKKIRYSNNLNKGQYTKLDYDNKQYEEEVKKQSEKIKRDLDCDYKQTIYHELSHILLIKSYDNENYLKYSIGNSVFKKNIFNNYNILGFDLDNCMDITFSNENQNLLQEKGNDALNEIENETFASYLYGNKMIEFKDSFVGDYSTKYDIVNDCNYVKDFDILMLFGFINPFINFSDLRFNSKEIIKNFNSIKFEPEFLESIISGFVKEIDNIKFKNKKNCNFIKENLKNLINKTPYEIFNLLLAVNDLFDDGSLGSVNNVNFRKYLDKFLLCAIEKNIVNLINNQDVIKDEYFFDKINNVLNVISDFIYYPNLIITNESDNNTHEEYFAINKCPISWFAKNSCDGHIAIFNKMINLVKNCMYNSCCDIYKCSFFKEQEEKEKFINNFEGNNDFIVWDYNDKVKNYNKYRQYYDNITYGRKEKNFNYNDNYSKERE